MSVRRRLLVVDDSADLAEAVRAIFLDHPRIEPVGVVCDPALIVVEVERLRPEVVLLDLTMPGGDPLEALRELRRRGVRATVLAYSGRDDEATVAEARAAGADAFLEKTVCPTAIETAIDAAIASRS